MRIADFHIHSHYSPDSSMLPLEAVDAAIKAGMTDMCFTEHMDLGHCLASFDKVPDIDAMHATICQLRNLFPEINIRNGLEVGYMTHTAKMTAEIISRQCFDYVLLSSHCVDGIDCYLPESKRGRDKITAYKRYLETVLDSVNDDNFEDYDCIGHIGYIAKCRHYEDNTMPYGLFPNLIDEILLSIIKKGKGIEVNTSGIKRAGHLLPHPSIISRYHLLGGRIITLGSDAHKADGVGENIRNAIKTVKSCGFAEFAVFCNRIPEFIPIG